MADRRRQLRTWLLALDRFEYRLRAEQAKARNAFIREAVEAYETNGTVPGWLNERHRRRLNAVLTDHYELVIPYFGEMTRRQIKSRRIERKQLSATFLGLMHEWVGTQALRKARMIAATDADDVRDAIEAGIEEGDGAEAISRRIRKVTSLTPSRAATVARTETHAAATFGAAESARIAEEELGVRLLKLWLPTVDDRTRPEHAEMASNPGIPLSEKFTVGGEMMDRPGDPSASPENLINCLHPKSVVGSCEIKAMTRHWYEGTILEIETENGHTMRVTPNHPVLGDKGWVVANHLKVGDCVVSSGRSQRALFRDFDVQDTVATAEQIFDALHVVGSAVRVDRGDVNFHGERPQSDVDVIRPARKLRLSFVASIRKPTQHFWLACTNLAHGRVLANGLLFFGCLEEFWRLVPNRVMSVCRQSGAFGRVGLSHSGKHGFAAVTVLEPSVSEATVHSSSVDSELLGNRFNRVSALEKFFGFFNVWGANTTRRAWIRDKVILVRHINYQGFVYNAETSRGYYTCNQIVNHNCRCAYAVEEATD